MAGRSALSTDTARAVKAPSRGRRPVRRPLPPLAPTPGQKVFLRFGAPVLLLVAVFWCTVHPLMDPDLWLHMAFGRHLLEHGTFPPGDVYSFTAAGRPWTSSGWAPSVLFQLLFSRLGAPALIYGVFAVIAATWLGIYAVSVRALGNRGSALLILLAALPAATLRFTPRPEIFSQLFLSGVMLVLLTAEARPRQERPLRRLWLLPLLFVGWSNSHAGFLVGLVPVGLVGLARAFSWRKSRSRADLLATAACSLCFFTWMANPYGFEIALLSQKIKDLPGLRQMVFEWQPLLGSRGVNLPPPAVAALALVAGGAAGGLWVNRTRARTWEAATALLFAALACYEIRHAALAVLVLATIAIRHGAWLDARLLRPAPLLPAAATAVAAAVCALQFAGLLHFGSGRPRAVLDDSLLPRTATAWLQKNRPPANLWNSYGPGGYLMYHLGPETKVFMDGRNDVYTPGVWKDYWAIQDGLLSLEDAAGRYGVNTFFIYAPQNNDNPRNLANRLSASPDWGLVYFDDAYAVYVRKTAEVRSWVEQREFRVLSPFAVERLEKALQTPELRNLAHREIATALERSGGSARAHLFAGYAAQQTGDEAAAAREREAARRINPWAAIMPSPGR